jgi:hypothetical protein
VTDREHGTKARYVFGPDEHGNPGKGCGCAACSSANRAYENNRKRMILYGRWQPYVDATAAREHVRALGLAGIGWKRAAALSGVSTGAMSKLLYGGPGCRPPTRRIRPETAAASLARRCRARWRHGDAAPASGARPLRLVTVEARRPARHAAVQFHDPDEARSGHRGDRPGRRCPV